MNSQKLMSSIISLLMLTLFACSSNTIIEESRLTPVRLNPYGSYPMTFTKLLFPRDTIVAKTVIKRTNQTQQTHIITSYGLDGQATLIPTVLPSVKQTTGTYSGRDYLPEVTYDESSFRDVASRRMRNQNYVIIGSSDELFDKGSSTNAKYQLGGIVHTITVITGDFSNAEMIIEWRLFEVENKETIYTKETRGTAKTRGNSNNAVLMAFEVALDNLLADREFVKHIRRY